MKLLFDQNISFRIVTKLKNHFPLISQVRLEGLENASDKEIWEFAGRNGYTIVTFDSDFYDLSVIWGPPPKIIWVKSLDQRTDTIFQLVLFHKDTILAMENENDLSCLEINNAP